MERPRRSARDERRRSLGQNFLVDPALVRRMVADVAADDLVVDLGAGTGALTLAAASRGARVLAVELDPVWSGRLAQRVRDRGLSRQVRVVTGDLLTVPLPNGEGWRVLASPPYGLTTGLLKRLLSDPAAGPARVDLVLQWEVARKHAAQPPATLLASTWAPWWEARVVERVPAAAFRPVSRIDSGWLRITRREPAILRPDLAGAWEQLLRREWDRALRYRAGRRAGGHRSPAAGSR